MQLTETWLRNCCKSASGSKWKLSRRSSRTNDSAAKTTIAWSGILNQAADVEMVGCAASRGRHWSQGRRRNHRLGGQFCRKWKANEVWFYLSEQMVKPNVWQEIKCFCSDWTINVNREKVFFSLVWSETYNGAACVPTHGQSRCATLRLWLDQGWQETLRALSFPPSLSLHLSHTHKYKKISHNSLQRRPAEAIKRYTTVV